MAIEFVGEPLLSNNNTSTAGYFMYVANDIPVGHWLIVEHVLDNNAISGTASTLTVSDSKGNVWTQLASQNRTPGSVVGDGTTLKVVYCQIKEALKLSDGDFINFLTSQAVSGRAINVSEWVGIDPVTPTSVTPVTVTGSTASSTTNITPTEAGQLVICGIAIEGPISDSITLDSDTVQGSWVALTAQGQSDPTADLNQTFRGQYKIVNGVTAQGWNLTLGTARDRVTIASIFNPNKNLPNRMFSCF